jgi:hypothetical protein
MHQPIPEQGRWLAQVVKGYFAYHAVPTNSASIGAFRTLRASGVDCSARPSREGYHAMNAKIRLQMLNGPLKPKAIVREKAPKKSLTWRASYKPPALPGDTYLLNRPFHKDNSAWARSLIWLSPGLCFFAAISATLELKLKTEQTNSRM